MALKFVAKKDEPKPTALPQGADRFVWDTVPPPPAKPENYADVLKFKPLDKR